MAESPESPGRPVGAVLKLAAVVALLVVAVGVAVYSAKTALSGPKEILIPMPADVPWEEYQRQHQGEEGIPPLPKGDAGTASTPSTKPPAPGDAAPAPSEAPAQPERPGRAGP